MSDETLQDRINKQTRREVMAFENDPVAKHQRELDWHWQRRLDERAARRRRALGDQPGGCDPQSGAYDPMWRFQTEG